tara:strand:- start:8442 stop:10331 length:1890 start_codon:yes stop_codon:yes gene_type:complete
MRLILFFIIFFYSHIFYSQIREDALNEAFSNIGDSISIEVFKFDIEKLKKFNINNDTILLDTTLNINKFYEFNFRRKDNFELIKPNNVGQSYNNLSYVLNESNYPIIGYNANKTQLQSSDDIYFYDVAYPMTELLFKSVFSQGQLTDVLFTTNVNRKLNFSLGFKALRSLGKYQNSLSGSKSFTFTYNYNSKKFSSKLFYLSQKLEKHESGGLSLTSISDFESQDPVFNERSKLNVKFEDAINVYFQRDFYSHNRFKLSDNKKNFSLNHTLHYVTVNNSYNQSLINNYYGGLIGGITTVDDKFKFRSINNKISFDISNFIFDFAEIGLINFNYEYFNLNSSNEKIKENSNLFSLKLTKNFKILDLDFDLQKKISGDRIGDRLKVVLKPAKRYNLDLNIKLSSVKSHPGLIYDNYYSGFSGLNWTNRNDLINTSSILINYINKKFGQFSLSGSIINNYVYVSTQNSDIESYIPQINQAEFDIKLFKLKYVKNFIFGKFSMNNSLLIQDVNQNDNVLNIPDFVYRNSFFITEKIFKNVLEIQSGFNFKIFSKFFINEYNPVISTFHIQDNRKIGGFPIIDFFLNAKIRQTRLFFIFEHINSSLSENNFFTTPSIPYRDSNFRFGLNWNLFN